MELARPLRRVPRLVAQAIRPRRGATWAKRARTTRHCGDARTPGNTRPVSQLAESWAFVWVVLGVLAVKSYAAYRANMK